MLGYGDKWDMIKMTFTHYPKFFNGVWIRRKANKNILLVYPLPPYKRTISFWTYSYNQIKWKTRVRFGIFKPRAFQIWFWFCIHNILYSCYHLLFPLYLFYLHQNLIRAVKYVFIIHYLGLPSHFTACFLTLIGWQFIHIT